MTVYHWDGEAMTDAIVLPAAVADDYLRIAAPEQITVLLWLARHHMTMDADACSAATGIPAAECEGCATFWAEQGVLCTSATTVNEKTVIDTPAARPTPIKPLLPEVQEYQRKHPDFTQFVETASARLGKPVSHSDEATLLYLYNTAGLPQDVILTEIAYAVSIGKPNMRYVEKLALDWADQELTTLPAVDEHIRFLEHCRRAAEKIEVLFGLSRTLTQQQAQTAYRWLEEWHFSDEMIRKAAAIAEEKIGKFSVPYISRILEGWYAEGIDKPEKIPVIGKKKKGAQATNPEESSLDLDGFENDLMRFTPVFQKKDTKKGG